MRESEKHADHTDRDGAGQRSTAENETQEPAEVLEDETNPDERARGGSAVWGSEGSGEAPRDPRRKENS